MRCWSLRFWKDLEDLYDRFMYDSEEIPRQDEEGLNQLMKRGS